jgi:hypothetical protein
MMVLSLLYNKRYRKTKIGGVELDATLTEEHRYTSRVTSYPVEDGTIISDHILNEPEVVVISGIVTDSPINILSQFNRSVTAFNTLVRMQQNREVMTLVTGIKVYQNMAITSLDVPRNLRTGQSLQFNIEFQKINFDTSVRLLLDEGNPFVGVQTKIPREIVRSNQEIPILQYDPPNSLKDQATNGVDVGVQSLQDIPLPTQAKILEGLIPILGVA